MRPSRGPWHTFTTFTQYNRFQCFPLTFQFSALPRASIAHSPFIIWLHLPQILTPLHTFDLPPMNFRLWAVSVNLTLAMVVNIFLLIFSAIKYHIHTAILFTWTDYKTIFLPIVRPAPSPIVTLPDRMSLLPVDCLCLRHCSLEVVLQPSSVRCVDLVPPAYVQRIQSSTQLSRGQKQPSLASSSVWEDLRTESSSLALDNDPSLRTAVVLL